VTVGGPVRLHAVAPADGPAEVPSDIARYADLDPARRALLLRMDELLDEIVFGTVVIVLQDGRVIQIETSEKIRLR
jgi:hypothetical protein